MKKVFNKGFTLIELLVVIAIIGILAAIVLSALGDARGKAKYVSAQSSISQVRAQAEIFYIDNGNSYSGLCGDAEYQRLEQAANDQGANVNCNDDDEEYAVEMEISNRFFCVDSRGNAIEDNNSVINNVQCQ